jgi:hypothetical protein
VGPLARKEAELWGLSGDDLYVIVSGRSGVISLEGDDERRAFAVHSYLQLAREKPALRLRWAETYLVVKDPFLQRSAVLELASLARNDKSRDAVYLLGRALKIPNLDRREKEAAIYGLEESSLLEALSELQVLVENKNAETALRVLAVEALARTPRGRRFLESWSSGENDKAYRKARELLRTAGPAAAPPETVDRIVDQILSGTPKGRQGAVAEAEKYAFSEQIAAAMKTVILRGGDQSERAGLIEALGQFNTPGAAKVLADIAVSDRLSADERGAIALTVSKMRFTAKEQFASELARKLGSLPGGEFAKAVLSPADR